MSVCVSVCVCECVCGLVCECVCGLVCECVCVWVHAHVRIFVVYIIYCASHTVMSTHVYKLLITLVHFLLTDVGW